MITLTKDTKIYGSFSRNPGTNGSVYFNRKFPELGMDAIYKPFYIHNIEEAIAGARALDLGGFAVAMPFKTAIMEYLHIIDPVARKIGAVNTVANDDSILYGYNTDWQGFWKVFEPFVNYNPEPIVVAGTGGFSKAVQYALLTHGVPYELIGRSGWHALDDMKHRLIVNATPVNIPSISKNDVFDCRPDSPAGKDIAKAQAKLQLKIYERHYNGTS